MIKLNPEDYSIICPSGDTGLLLVTLTDPDGGELPPIDGVAIFAVCKKSNNGKSYLPIAALDVAIVNNTATINITNKFSRGISPGDYFWDIRIVTDPERDAEGNVIALDDTDEVHSLFAGSADGMPKYEVPGVAKDV